MIDTPDKDPPTMVCVLQDETWRWPSHLGEKTEGDCAECGAPIYFEKQNKPFRKICNYCFETKEEKEK